MTRPSALLAAAPAALALTAWIGCGATEPVPAGPQDPADPAGAAAAPGPAPAAAEHPAGDGHEPDHEHEHDHDHGAASAGDAADATEEHADRGDEGAGAGGALIAAEMKAYRAARPVFDEHCARCHSSSGSRSKMKTKARGHFAMDGYPFGGHHANELGATIREVLGADGSEPTMPEDDPGAVEGRELELVVAWTRAYDDAVRAGAGYHGRGEGYHHGGNHEHQGAGDDHGDGHEHHGAGHDQGD